MLRVHVNQLFAQFFHLHQRSGRIIDKCTTFTRSVNFTTKDTFILIFQFIFFKERPHAITGNFKTGFNHTFCSPLPDRLHIGTLSQQQTDSSQNNGLSGPRFTSNYRETATKIYIEFLDKRIILYV